MRIWFEDSAFSTMTSVDFLDIGILSWFVYRGLLLVRGTRAQQSMIGLLILAAIYVASDMVGLATLNWTLNNVFVYIIIAVLILFQDDIRNALSQAGGTIFTRGARRSNASVLEEVIAASFALANRRIGALIVLERLAMLEPFTEGAHPVDGQVTAELLQAIFHPSSPIHDGAVVIRGERIMAAGVFLPLSLSKTLSRAYGTRHRAGIGLTERTDAICLVISEERGTVSLVQGGVVTPVAGANDLRERMTAQLEAVAPATPDAVDTPAGDMPSAKKGGLA